VRKRNDDRAIGQITVSTSLATEFHLMDEVDSAQSQSSSDSDHDFKPAVRKTPSQNVEKQFTSQTTSQLFTPHVTNALDRNKTSDRVALRLMVPIASALGCDPSTMPLSRSTIRRARKKERKEHAETIRSEFAADHPLVLHWDGKILPEIFGAGNVDRLPVLVTGDGAEKLLGVPKVASGTGYNESLAVYNLLESWKLREGSSLVFSYNICQHWSFQCSVCSSGKQDRP